MTTRPSQEMIEEGYKQARINARNTALTCALQARSLGTNHASSLHSTELYSADMLIADAQKIEGYILDGIKPPQPSNIITPPRGH